MIKMGNPDESSLLPLQLDSNSSFNNATEDQSRVYELPSSAIVSLNSKDISLFPNIGSSNVPAHITHLHLNYNSITKLPTALHQALPDLRLFSIDGNELAKLPDDFGLMLSLEELYICENKLTALPNSLCKLSNLKILKACGNALRSLHPEIGQNTCLEILSVDENYLRRFPPTLGLLRNLKVLEANSNKLTSLPETFHFLKSLETVDLSKNRISKIPDSFSELQFLKYVDLSENQLVSLWDSSESCCQLEKIFLELNSIMTLPPWFSDLINVSEINLNSNNLSSNSLPDGFGNNLLKLRTLDLRGNFITELPDSFGCLLALDELHLGTPFDYLEKKAAFQNGNWLRWFPQNFGQLRNLIYLGAQENQLEYLPDDIGNLVNLKEIYLGSNLLTSLPESFCSLLSLEKCQLSKNKLRTLPEHFGNLGALVELHLDLNKIRNLPSSLKRCKRLELLDLADNRLTEVPKDILAGTSKLKALDMQRNRFDLPFIEIPHISKKAHYTEPNPLQSGNWRGRNNSPYTSFGNDANGQKVEEDKYLSGGEEGTSLSNSSEHQDGSGGAPSGGNEEETGEETNVFWDSSDNEDWEKECCQPSLGTASQAEPGTTKDVGEEEENWDDEVASPSRATQAAGSEEGQFDLDADLDHENSFHQPLYFDFFGNASRRIDLDVYNHRSLPYLQHSKSHSPFVVDLWPLENGQFED